MSGLLVTGAAGFVGSHLAHAALEQGREVIALVRPGDPAARLRDIRGRLTLREADLADTGAVRRVLAEVRPDACVHAAWYAEPRTYLHATENIQCLVHGIGLLEALAAIRCTRVVMIGTCAEYDSDNVTGPLREDARTRPATLYASTKLALGLVGRTLAAGSGVSFAWARLFSMYGPGEHEGRAIPSLIRALRADLPFPATPGGQIRDYLHVADVAAALLTLADAGAEGIFNVGSGVPVSVRSLMETIGGQLGRAGLIQFGALPHRDWDPPYICADSGRLRALGWAPAYSLPAGLQETIEWWKERATHDADVR